MNHAVHRATVLPILCLLVAGCGDAPTPEAPRAESIVRSAEEPSVTFAEGAKIVVLGDSLAAGFGLDVEMAFPSRVEETLLRRGWAVEVINAGVSGDTTAGGRSRLEWLLSQDPDLVVVGLGANDGLRGGSLAEMESNLRDIVERSLGSGARVLVLGMKIPLNYGPDYAAAFESIYQRLAREYDLALMPFLLEGVGGRPELNQADGIHPNEEGQRRVASEVLPYLEAELRAIGRSPSPEAAGPPAKERGLS